MVCMQCVYVSVVDRDIMWKDEEVKCGGGYGGHMEVDVGEVSWCGGRAVVHGAMDENCLCRL